MEEVFETEQIVVPFERQIIRNETLPEGETRLVQSGVNGVQEVTYRRILENGGEISKTAVKTIVLTESLPEIVMVGAQASFTPLNIPRALVYLAGGNAWVMEGSTANRRLIVSSGDLGGRIFKLGELEPAELAAWMGRASIFAAPARYEPFGLAALEAALAGCTLVLGDLATYREIWGEHAIYVPPRDPPALAFALEALIPDPLRRGALAAGARVRALALTPRRMAEAYRGIYDELTTATARQEVCA